MVSPKQSKRNQVSALEANILPEMRTFMDQQGISFEDLSMLSENDMKHGTPLNAEQLKSHI